jgi:hypothetical protein
MNERIKSLIGKSKIVLKQITIYGIIVITCVGSFFIGRFYDKLTKKDVPLKFEVSTIKKEDVNLAIDQNNNLIVIDNNTGNYTIYQDSVGKTIFSLYAKNVWGQHNVSQ